MSRLEVQGHPQLHSEFEYQGQDEIHLTFSKGKKKVKFGKK